MMRSAADYRALRESTGVSQNYVAQALSVNVVTVKRWERGISDILTDAWQLLDELAALQELRVRDAVNAVRDAQTELGSEPQNVIITYYRSQKQYDEYGRDVAEYGFVNAISRRVASVLVEQGYMVVFEYPSE